jgi:FPC/CPF motif-containing protein YcgG
VLFRSITDPTQQAVCVLTNAANASLTQGQMTITALDASSTAVILARVTNKFATDFSNTGYYLSFVAANATVQSTGAPTGLYSVLLAPVI